MSTTPLESPEHGEIQVTLKDYLTGFGLSMLLTAIPFWLVMSGVISNKPVVIGLIALFAVVQIVVHMIYFLHLNTTVEEGWNLLATLFTIILVVITLSGSLWVMHHLNTNMHPEHSMQQGP